MASSPKHPARRKVIKAFGAQLPGHETYANRTSYVITPDGKVIYTYTDMHPDQHVANTLKAIQDWKAKQAKCVKRRIEK